MKRRDFLRGTLVGSIAVPLVAKAGVGQSLINETPPIVLDEPSKHLTYEVSNDVNDFIISYNHLHKFIEIKPKMKHKPVLDILEFHRHISDQLDNSVRSGQEFCILDPVPYYAITPMLIGMENGWKLTPNGCKALHGGIIQGNKHTCTIRVMCNENANYDRVRNVSIRTNEGHKLFYDTGGIFKSPLLDIDKQYTMMIDYEYRTINGWEPQHREYPLGKGVVYIPFLS